MKSCKFGLAYFTMRKRSWEKKLCAINEKNIYLSHVPEWNYHWGKQKAFKLPAYLSLVKHEVSTDVNFSRVSKMLYLSSVTLILQLESRDVKQSLQAALIGTIAVKIRMLFKYAMCVCFHTEGLIRSFPSWAFILRSFFKLFHSEPRMLKFI